MKVCQVFYISMHILSISIFYYTDNDLLQLTIPTCIYWLLKLSSCTLFFKAGKNPGYLSKSEFKDCSELEDTDWPIPTKSICGGCNLTQPYRTKHCSDCEECVGKYDHHCFWLGSCIGELNHFKFVWYLILESISLGWTSYSVVFGDDLLIILLNFIVFIVSFGFGALVIGLGVFHVYIITIGTTTWEIIRRRSISYLKPYPYNFHPFSKSCFQNWLDCACAYKLTVWVLPRPTPVYPFNWCDNQYWSCC
jgi:palmitoyltransferase